MITQEMLDQDCFKQRLHERSAQLRAEGCKEHPTLRTAETVHGFLDLDEANRIIQECNPHLLVNACGLAGISNDEVVFLAGESSYGRNVLQEWGFNGMVEISASKEDDAPCVKDGFMTTAEEFLRVYFSGQVHLNSMQDLLDYLNHGRLPRRSAAEYKALGDAASYVCGNSARA